MLVASNLSMGFLDQWCQIVVEAIGGFHTSVVRCIEGVGFRYVAEVGEVDWGYFSGAATQMVALASIPIGE
jgi:hypothetical protein